MSWASPLTGVFFFPRGGFVATDVKLGANYVEVTNLKTDEEHEYAWDMVSHIILDSVGREIPDLLMAHSARTKFAQYYGYYTEAYRALEFADTASSSSQTYPVWVSLSQIVVDRREATKDYRSGDVEASNQLMEDILLRIRSAKLRAERVLRLSLFMIYVAEYGVVCATFLIALSITLHFVRRPRVKLVGITKYQVGEGSGAKTLKAASETKPREED
jgi:hypothetical protein